MTHFRVVSPFSPAGDQAAAIEALARGVQENLRFQTLKGVTGSGKTFTMAQIIEQAQLPTLVLSHNKTLAAQLYREFKDFFPDNAVEYFVSYYDYYQPEAYVPGKDLYIEKDASINQEIERMRLSATTSLMERRDVIVVATVSCIYGLGNPEDYREMRVEREAGRDGRHARPHAPPGVPAVRAQRRGARALALPRARRRAGDLPFLREAGDPRRVLRRRDRAHPPDRPPVRGRGGGAGLCHASTPPSTS